MKKVGAEQRTGGFLEQMAGLPRMRQMGRTDKAERRAPVVRTSPSCRPWAGRSAKSFTFTTAPTKLQSGCARGAIGRNSLRAPHSSDSKWLNAIHRSVAGSIAFATASRTIGNIAFIPV